jgi:hypothetical protein
MYIGFNVLKTLEKVGNLSFEPFKLPSCSLSVVQTPDQNFFYGLSQIFKIRNVWKLPMDLSPFAPTVVIYSRNDDYHRQKHNKEVYFLFSMVRTF